MLFSSIRENLQLAAEKKDLEGRALVLEENLKEAVQSRLLPVRHKIDSETPVDKMLNLLSSLMEVSYNKPLKQNSGWLINGHTCH